MTDDGVAATRAWLKAMIAVVVWGASFIATKVALNDLSPVTVVWLRFGIGVIILASVVGVRHQFHRIPLRTLGYFGFLGLLGITFHQWLQSTGLQTARATTTAWIVTTIPVFMALLARVILHERLGWMGIGGIAVAALGVLVIVSEGSISSLFSGSAWTTGDVLVLASAPNWALFSILSRKGLKEHPAPVMMFYVMTAGWLCTSVLFAAGGGMAELGHVSPASWVSIAFLGILCSGIAYIFWYDGLKALPAGRVGSLIYLEPLVAMVVAAIVLSEAITPAGVGGGALILAGVWIVGRNEGMRE